MHCTSPALTACRPTITRGRCSGRSWTFSRAPGSSPTRASGRCAGRAATSPIRRCSPGWRSIGRSTPSSASTCPARSTAGGRLRDEVHREVCREAFNVELNSFVQAYGSDELDASTLLIPLVGFLPGDDPRVLGTIDAIQRDLTRDGFVERYRAEVAQRRRRAARRRGRVPAVLVLARRCAPDGGTRRRGPRAVRAAARDPERSRPALRGVRPGREAPARELPAGVHARRSRQLGLQPLAARRTGASAHATTRA